MLNILLNMSVSGGIVILIWYLSYPLCKRVFNASWHYAVLKISMLFMLFPLNIFTSLFSSSLIKFFTNKSVASTELISGTAVKNIAPTFINIIPTLPQEETNTIPYLLLIWIAGFVILSAFEIRKYFKFKKLILRFCNDKYDKETYQLFLSCKEQVGVRKKVSFKTSNYISSPFTTGIFKPIIVLPDAEMIDNEKLLALTHELTHIKNNDMLIKFFSIVISVIHWFNPLAYLLRKKVAVISEYYCDECLINSMTKAQRRAYGDLVIKAVFGVIGIHETELFLSLSMSSRNTKKRLKNILKFKKPHKRNIAFSVVMVMVIASIATAYTFIASAAEELKSGQSSRFKNIYQSPIYEIDETDVISDLLTEFSNEDEIFDNTVIHTVPVGAISLDERVMTRKEGETVAINVIYLPKTTDIEVGILEPDGTFRYVKGTSGLTTHTFDINSDGDYQLLIRNNSNSKVDILGAGIIESHSLEQISHDKDKLKY